MQKKGFKFGIVQLQWLIWLLVSASVFASLLAMDGPLQAAIYTLLNVGSYSLIIYGNISVLHPKLWRKEKYLAYTLGALLLILLVAVLRALLSFYIYSAYFSTKPVPFTYAIIFTYAFSGVLIFLLSFVVRYAIDYFRLLEVNEAIKLRQDKAELELLKSQVQPHFLFNTLNNIYYEAYREAPKTALLIERLADMMRYMVEENTKEKVLLSKEVAFLENYIALEQIRQLHVTALDFHKNYNSQLQLPPMLLITFIENIFKHGVDKTSTDNKISIVLREEGGWLVFKTVNSLDTNQRRPSSGSGLKNLEQRLQLLYGNAFEMAAGPEGNDYIAYFKIPLQ